MNMHNEPNEKAPQQDQIGQSQDADGSIISGHLYDGIEEYDNPMPGWWVWMFVASIVWTPIYILGVHQFDFINSYEDDLALAQAELVEMRQASEEENPSSEVDDAMLAGYFGNGEHEAAGEVLFSANCAMCHGNAGEGLIGPNLTDEFWVHGNSPTDIFRVISEGVLEKGMTPWESILTVNERAQLVAYVQILAGTNPEGAKAPEGEALPDDRADEGS